MKTQLNNCKIQGGEMISSTLEFAEFRNTYFENLKIVQISFLKNNSTTRKYSESTIKSTIYTTKSDLKRPRNRKIDFHSVFTIVNQYCYYRYFYDYDYYYYYWYI